MLRQDFLTVEMRGHVWLKVKVVERDKGFFFFGFFNWLFIWVISLLQALSQSVTMSWATAISSQRTL